MKRYVKFTVAGAEYEASYVWDGSYGADADGNRGEGRWEHEETICLDDPYADVDCHAVEQARDAAAAEQLYGD